MENYKTLKRSFGFNYEGLFISGTLLQNYDTGELSAYIYIGNEEFSTIAEWKKDSSEQKKFIEVLRKFCI